MKKPQSFDVVRKGRRVITVAVDPYARAKADVKAMATFVTINPDLTSVSDSIDAAAAKLAKVWGVRIRRGR